MHISRFVNGMLRLLLPVTFTCPLFTGSGYSEDCVIREGKKSGGGSMLLEEPSKWRPPQPVLGAHAATLAKFAVPPRCHRFVINYVLINYVISSCHQLCPDMTANKLCLA